MHGADAARIGTRGPCAIERAFELVRRGEICRCIWTGTSRWRHRSGAQLFDDGLPYFGVAARVRCVEAIERKSARARPLVMATDAVLGDETGGVRGVRGAGCVGCLVRRRSYRDAGCYADREERGAHRDGFIVHDTLTASKGSVCINR